MGSTKTDLEHDQQHLPSCTTHPRLRIVCLTSGLLPVRFLSACYSSATSAVFVALAVRPVHSHSSQPSHEGFIGRVSQHGVLLLSVHALQKLSITIYAASNRTAKHDCRYQHHYHPWPCANPGVPQGSRNCDHVDGRA